MAVTRGLLAKFITEVIIVKLGVAARLKLKVSKRRDRIPWGGCY